MTRCGTTTCGPAPLAGLDLSLTPQGAPLARLILNVGGPALPRSGLRRDAAARSRAQRSGSGREEGGDGKGAARLPYPAVGYPENKRERREGIQVKVYKS